MTDSTPPDDMPPDPFAAPEGPDPVPTPPQGIPPLALANYMTPTAIDMQIVDNPGQRMIALRIESINGSFLFGWTTEQAAQIGQAMVDAAAKYPNTGIIPATADQMPPPPTGPNGGLIL